MRPIKPGTETNTFTSFETIRSRQENVLIPCDTGVLRTGQPRGLSSTRPLGATGSSSSPHGKPPVPRPQSLRQGYLPGSPQIRIPQALLPLMLGSGSCTIHPPTPAHGTARRCPLCRLPFSQSGHLGKRQGPWCALDSPLSSMLACLCPLGWAECPQEMSTPSHR